MALRNASIPGGEPKLLDPSTAEGRRQHVLDLDDFSPAEISTVLENTTAMNEVLQRDIKKVPTLRGRVIVTLFYEASTRTRVSFEEAGKILSADVINVGATGSSVEKGESLLNTGLTLQAMGVNVIVIRHPHSGAPHLLAHHLDRVGIVNAGDGLHAHPTQSLLDLYTVQQKLGCLDGLRVVIVGDVLHSRVARSNLWGFTKMGSQVTLCGPSTLLPPDFPSSGHFPDGHPLASVTVDTNLDRAVEGADVVMALRLQAERQDAGFFPSLREYVRRWQVTAERLSRAQDNVLVMHPGPMNEGIELGSDIAHGGRSVIEEQVTNGVAVRMALLYQLSLGDDLD